MGDTTSDRLQKGPLRSRTIIKIGVFFVFTIKLFWTPPYYAVSLKEKVFELIRRNLGKSLNLRWQNQYLECTYGILDPYNMLYRDR